MKLKRMLITDNGERIQVIRNKPGLVQLSINDAEKFLAFLNQTGDGLLLDARTFGPMKPKIPIHRGPLCPVADSQAHTAKHIKP